MWLNRRDQMAHAPEFWVKWRMKQALSRPRHTGRGDTVPGSICPLQGQSEWLAPQGISPVSGQQVDRNQGQQRTRIFWGQRQWDVHKPQNRIQLLQYNCYKVKRQEKNRKPMQPAAFQRLMFLQGSSNDHRFIKDLGASHLWSIS